MEIPRLLYSTLETIKYLITEKFKFSYDACQQSDLQKFQLNAVPQNFGFTHPIRSVNF